VRGACHDLELDVGVHLTHRLPIEINGFFLGREQVQQQRRQASLAKELGDLPVPAAEAAAAAAVREDHEPLSARWKTQVSLQDRGSHRDLHGLHRRERAHDVLR
jgi:hypothetical protein